MIRIECFRPGRARSGARRSPCWTRRRRPRYPRDLRDKGIPGRAALGVVVNAAGRVERQTMRIVDANFLAFAEAVTEVLPRYRIAPATIDGCPVPQQVLMPFGFSIR